MNTRFSKILVASALVSSLFTLVPAHAQDSSDAALAAQVKAALMQATPFHDNDVDLVVNVVDGKVNLSGWVTYAGDDVLARKIASAVPGVKSVTESFHFWSSEGEQRIN